MVDINTFVRQLSILCTLVVMSTLTLAFTGIVLNGIVRAFLYLWKKMPMTGKGIDNLINLRLNDRAVPKKKRVTVKKKPARVHGVVIGTPAKPQVKQGVNHV